MTRYLTFLIFIISRFIMTSQTTTTGQSFKVDTYFMSFLPKDELLCGLDSSSRTDDCFEFYFTKRGNVIYKHYSPIEGQAWFYFGTYLLSDTGITYTTTNRYFVKMDTEARWDNNGNEQVDKRIDHTDYNKGKLKKQKPFVEIIPKNNCKEFPYAIAPVNQSKRVTIIINTPHTVSPGSVFESNEKQKEILVRKIRTINIFRDL